jgi:hypothetical protein
MEAHKAMSNIIQMMKPRDHVFNTGDQVRDFPSNTLRTIKDIVHLDDGGVCYELDDDTPRDPTGDGAFPNNWRIPSEVDFPENERPEGWTY